MSRLHRGIAYIPRSNIDCEVVIAFFECAGSAASPQALHRLLTSTWGLPDEAVEIYNIHSEQELLAQAFGDAATGDARLLEVGFDGTRPMYAERARTLLLVRPATLRRLVAAQELTEDITRLVQSLAHADEPIPVGEATESDWGALREALA